MQDLKTTLKKLFEKTGGTGYYMMLKALEREDKE